jgi:formate hydrogenlyase subunit 4
MLARILYRLTPLLVVATLLFALLYGWTAVTALRQGNVPFAAFYGLFAMGGLALAAALWSARQKVAARRRELERAGMDERPAPR